MPGWLWTTAPILPKQPKSGVKRTCRSGKSKLSPFGLHLSPPANQLTANPSFSFFVDPDDVWLGLCRREDAAKKRCVAFLKYYVKKSRQEFPILVPLEETGMEGTKETEWRQTVTSAHTLLNVWRCLVAEADCTLLLKKRQDDPANVHTWRLKFMDHTNAKGQGPVFEVSKVGRTWPFFSLFPFTNLSPLPSGHGMSATPAPSHPNPPFFICSCHPRSCFC